MKINTNIEEYNINLDVVEPVIQSLHKRLETIEFLSVEMKKKVIVANSYFDTINYDRIEESLEKFRKYTEYSNMEMLELLDSIKKLIEKIDMILDQNS
ncbi:MAG: hypothetical protein KH380_05285 [Coprobacillus sp.]|jgi:phage-related protein|nr:hypothetical protein [Coprobacillus sp.]